MLLNAKMGLDDGSVWCQWVGGRQDNESTGILGIGPRRVEVGMRGGAGGWGVCCSPREIVLLM